MYSMLLTMRHRMNQHTLQCFRPCMKRTQCPKQLLLRILLKWSHFVCWWKSHSTVSVDQFRRTWNVHDKIVALSSQNLRVFVRDFGLTSLLDELSALKNRIELIGNEKCIEINCSYSACHRQQFLAFCLTQIPCIHLCGNHYENCEIKRMDFDIVSFHYTRTFFIQI